MMIPDIPLHIERLGSAECWPWKLGKSAGYGCARIDGRSQNVHRFVYELAYGTIPVGLVVDHTCHNADPSCPGNSECSHRSCQNPAHMELTTIGENRRRAPVAGRAKVHAEKTHCDSGHELSGGNLKPGKTRICRACANARNAEYYARKRGDVG